MKGFNWVAFILGEWLIVVALVVIFVRFFTGWTFRQLLFGWICALRGQHVGRRVKSIVPMYDLGSPGRGPAIFGANVTFVCICGERKHLTCDYQRGGRIPVPHAWTTEHNL